MKLFDELKRDRERELTFFERCIDVVELLLETPEEMMMMPEER